MGNAPPILLDSTTSVTIRHSESEAIASEAATASCSLLDATAAAGLLKPAGPGDRVMVESLQKSANQSHRAGRISLARCRFVTVFTGKIAARPAGKAAEVGRGGRYAHDPRNQAPLFVSRQASAAAWWSGSSIPPTGCESIETKPGICSRRLSQVRMAGKVERS